MKIRSQMALNIDGRVVMSGEVVDLPDAEAKSYLSQGLAVTVGRGESVTVEKRVVEAPETADSPRARKPSAG